MYVYMCNMYVCKCITCTYVQHARVHVCNIYVYICVMCRYVQCVRVYMYHMYVCMCNMYVCMCMMCITKPPAPHDQKAHFEHSWRNAQFNLETWFAFFFFKLRAIVTRQWFNSRIVLLISSTWNWGTYSTSFCYLADFTERRKCLQVFTLWLKRMAEKDYC